MRSHTRLALCVAVLVLPLGAAPIAKNSQIAKPFPAKLHIKAFTIVSPVCGKPVVFQLDVQNLSSGAFAGSTNVNNRPGAVAMVTDTATKQSVVLPLNSIAGGATLSVPVSVGFVAACPGQACWEASLLLFQSDGTPNLPEWDGVKPRVCLKQSCAFEITGPFTR